MNRNKEERKTIYPSSNLKRKKEKEKRVGKLSIPARSFLACNQTASRIFPGENFRLARSVHGTSKVLFPRKEKRLSRIFTVDFEPRPTTPFRQRRFLRGPISQTLSLKALPFIAATHLSTRIEVANGYDSRFNTFFLLSPLLLLDEKMRNASRLSLMPQLVCPTDDRTRSAARHCAVLSSRFILEEHKESTKRAEPFGKGLFKEDV